MHIIDTVSSCVLLWFLLGPLRVMLPSLESCSKCPIKLGEIFLMFEEDLLNYAFYFKNMPVQSMLMNEGGHTFFAVS